MFAVWASADVTGHLQGHRARREEQSSPPGSGGDHERVFIIIPSYLSVCAATGACSADLETVNIQFRSIFVHVRKQ